MENRECWMCKSELDEDEVQYCSVCELAMLTELLEGAQASN
jgi:hypothetical protein